jgi:hypothetical protein
MSSVGTPTRIDCRHTGCIWYAPLSAEVNAGMACLQARKSHETSRPRMSLAPSPATCGLSFGGSGPDIFVDGPPAIRVASLRAISDTGGIMARFAWVSVISLVVFLAAGAPAATVFVPPGPGTPVQDAIDAANPNDTIRLDIGAYPEHITITKALKLRGVTSLSQQFADTTHFEGGCTAGPVVTVAADNVQIRDLAVGSDADGAFDVVGRSHVKLKSLFALSNCSPVTAPAYNVAQSTRVVLDRVWAAGFGLRPVGPAGIRIADAPGGAAIRVRHAISGGYDAGMLLENDGVLAVRVSAGDFNYNTTAILLQGTSRAVVDHNEAHHNTTSGIQIDAGSSGNVLVRNLIDDSGTDVIDAGAANCWRNNQFTTGSVPACP